MLMPYFLRRRYTYNPSTSKWSLLTINAKKKKMGGSKKRRAKQAAAVVDPDAMAVDEDVDMDAAVLPEEEDSDDEPVSFEGSPCDTSSMSSIRTKRWRLTARPKAERPQTRSSCP